MVKRSQLGENGDPYRGLKKEDYIQILDTINHLPKIVWDYLVSIPEPLTESDLAKLAQKRLIRKIHNLYCLMPLGNSALTRSSVNGEPTSLNPVEIAFLQSLFFLPPVDKIKCLEERNLITNQGGQFVLTPRGLAAKTEISAGADYVHRTLDPANKFDEDDSDAEY